MSIWGIYMGFRQSGQLVFWRYGWVHLMALAIWLI